MSDTNRGFSTDIRTDVSIRLGAELDKESTGKLTDALIDAFSPVSESLGAIGDYIRLFRVDVAERITRRAKVLADSAGFSLKAPPVKFLLPFYEKASCENEQAIEELWAQLLAAAGGEFDPRMVSYVDVISKLSGPEATKLRELVLSVDRWSYPFESGVSGRNIESATACAEEFLFPSEDMEKFSKNKRDRALRHFERKFNPTAGELLWITVTFVSELSGKKHYGAKLFHYPEATKKFRGIYQNLETKGLVNIRHERIRNPLDPRQCDVSWAELTPLAVDLVHTLEPGAGRIIYGRM